MKKINILLLFILIVSSAAFTQENFYPISLNDEGQRKLVNNSTLIIEGKKIISKGPILENNSGNGSYYSLCTIKPTAVLKGTTDTSKTYQFLVKKGSFSFFIVTETGQYGNDYHLNHYGEAAVIIPDYGIFFINENIAPLKNNYWLEMSRSKLVPVDLYSLFPNAKMICLKDYISYGKKYPKEKTLKYLSDKLSLKATQLP